MPRIKHVLISMLAVLASLAIPHVAQASTTFAQNDGVRIAFEVIGEGEPIVLIPGFSQSRLDWKDAGFVDAFVARGRQVVLIDPRGHGDSGKPHEPDGYRRELLASDIIAVLNQLKIRKADMLGYSRGGANVIAVALHAPNRVRSVTLGGSHPFAQNMGFFRDIVADGLDRWVAVIEKSVGPLPGAARARFLANDVEALRAAVASDRSDLSAALRATGIPVLLYAGTSDPLHEPAQRYAEDGTALFLALPGLNHMQAFFAVEPVVEAVEKMRETLRKRKQAQPKS